MIIDKLIVENIPKIEFKFDKIDVKDLSSMLNIGINYGGRFTKVESNSSKSQEKKDTKKKGEYKPSEKEDLQVGKDCITLDSMDSNLRDHKKPKINIIFRKQ